MIFFVPARKGSMRVNGKNTRYVCGCPLVEWTFRRIDEVKGDQDSVIVSSDDPEVLTLSDSHGFSSVLRPSDYSGHSAKMSDVLSFHFRHNHTNDDVCVLYPTSLLRSAAHIRDAIALWSMRKDVGTTLMSVSPVYHRPYGLMKVNSEGFLFCNHPDGRSFYQSQNMPVDYRANGAIYILPIELIKAGAIDSQLFGPLTIPFIMSEEDGLEIDTEQELVISECVMNRRLANCERSAR